MSDRYCFHCDLPVTEQHPPKLTVFGEPRQFCCQGCKAVCQAVIQSGNEDYYRFRDAAGKTAAQQDLGQLLNQLKLYDKPEIQRDFVRTHKEHDKEYKEAWLILEEIRCAACMWLNERTVRQLDGVLDVQADYTGQQVKVRWDPQQVELSTILSAITQIGYIAHPFDPRHREALNKEQEQRSIKRILFAVILGMVVMQTAIGSYFYGAANAAGEYPLWITLSRWTSLVATAFILAYPGQLFFRNAWRDLRNHTLGMDVPIALGLLVAWSGSVYSTVTGTGEVYYESIAMFVLFILIARYVELRARISATDLLDRTSKIIPASVTRIRDGEAENVAVIELQPGDRIQLSPGETVPVDGILRTSQSSFDESLLSGEVLPVKRVEGEAVLGGSINIEQPVTIEVLHSSSHSTYHKIQQLTQQSVNNKPYYVDIAERVAGKFVGAILLIAVITLVYWFWVDPSHAIGHTVAVLIVTCPCALALASPVALSLCAAGLARFHITALRMSAIEEVAHVNTLVFDKTGTLTTGKPSVDMVITLGQQSEEQYLAIAAGMEKSSEHPFARAIRQAVSDSQTETELTFEACTNHPGQGVEAMLDGQQWRLGNDTFVGKPVFEAQLQSQLKNLREKGISVLYLSNKEGVQAIFCLADPLRDGVDRFLQSVQSVLPITEIVILSGDHPQSVQSVARQLGISHAFGNLSPQDKLEWIKTKQHQGGRILMFGDGINDAPTLARADVSMSFSDATDLAKSQCDFMILRGDYDHLADAAQLMVKTRRIVIQNLIWALLYNVLAIPAAAAGVITPWMAAVGMSLSSFVVVFNALRLRNSHLISGKTVNDAGKRC